MEKTIVVMECLMPEFLTGLGQLWADNQVMGMIASVLVTMMMMMRMIKLVYVGSVIIDCRFQSLQNIILTKLFKHCKLLSLIPIRL